MRQFFKKSGFSCHDRCGWIVRPPKLARWLLPGVTWRMPGNKKEVFITFDDGPIPEVTPKVIEILSRHNAKATFFCVGENVARHPDVYKLLIDSGMMIGNHTHEHLKAWSTPRGVYFRSILRCQGVTGSKIFRPPHGQLYPNTAYLLRKRFSRVVMWDVLSMDYDPRVTTREVVENVTRLVRPGSIIVFHDSLKAWPRLKEALPEVLKFLDEEGYQMSAIS